MFYKTKINFNFKLNFVSCVVISYLKIFKSLESQTIVLERLLSGEISMNSAVSKAVQSTFRHVSPDDTVGKASRIIQNNGYVFIVNNGKYEKTLHRSDIFNFIENSS